jgi:hypothetical protein
VFLQKSLLFQNNPKEIQILEVHDDFYMEFNPWKKPDGVKVIGKVPFVNRRIDEQEFKERLKAPGFDQSKLGFFQKVKQVFS